MKHLLPILLLASCTWGPGDNATTAQCEVGYRPMFVAGFRASYRAEDGSIHATPWIFRGARRVWFWQGGSIGTVAGIADGPDAVLVNGVRVIVREDGCVR